MKYKLVGRRGDIPFEKAFSENALCWEIEMNEYVRDKNGGDLRRVLYGGSGKRIRF